MTIHPEHPEHPEVPEHPEIPYPFPPERIPPRRNEPVVVPMVSIGGGDPWQQLTEQRRILVSGPLDRVTVTALSAQLMALDGESSRDVEIVISSAGGPLAEIFPVLDVLDLMRARVNTTCVGTAAGTAVALVASGTGVRRSASNTTFCLRINDRQTIDGTTSDILRQASELDVLRDRYVAALAAKTGLNDERLVADVEHGEYLTATEARDLGIVDAVDESSSNTSRNTTSS